MKRFTGLFQPKSLELMRTLMRMELSLMEQGTAFGFLLSFANNILMLLVFHALFVTRFIAEVPNTWIYLLLGIVQWNLYMNISLAGFACFVYRQKVVMGYSFPRETLILARTAAVFVPYIVELTLILGVARYFHLPFTLKYAWLPLFLVNQFLFCAAICAIFAFVGVLHKNIIPFWNLMFRLLSFATPIFYIPVHFKTWWVEMLYSINPFTIFMLWVRDIAGANGFPFVSNPLKVTLGSIGIFLLSYILFRTMEAKVGDNL
ncbi:MAG: ABC transporter permease [Bdellovibrionota bacterium]